MAKKTTEEKLMALPFAIEWVEFKGEICVAQINYQETERVGRPMLDISYCMTRALNQVILQTVQWDKSKFKPCHLTSHWETKKLYHDANSGYSYSPPTGRSNKH